ncbi:hypothetical protein PTE_01132 [Photorhabdus khanii NC19]|uniref:Uncharacterized protein n=1 Tax=Photorhabdus khanii NC19 TaxID=1004151 RepID=W3V992_9GAMM|nr:hypothetical protein PTE_01132 [Photorhabdus khanii NC19]
MLVKFVYPRTVFHIIKLIVQQVKNIPTMIVNSMKTNGWKGEPIDVVKMPDGKITSMDNTRISAAREAGIEVKATVRSFDEPLTPEMQKARNWEQYQTWGEAIQGRINNQSGKFSELNPYGAEQSPKIRGKK